MDKPKDYPISFAEMVRAKSIVYNHLVPTQLTHYQELSELLGAEVYIKHENHNPTGTFKLRGAINLMHHLRQAGITGVVTFSTGNHGYSVAAAATLFRLEATIVVPENNNPTKNRNIRATGALLIEAGKTFEEASMVVSEIVRERGDYYVHPANEPHLINGVGTEFLEIYEQLPDIDAVILPIGAGSEAAAAVTVLKTINPKVEIYAVQAEKSSAAFLSWQSGTIQTAQNETFAGGFATGIGYEMPFSIYHNQLEDFVLISEDEIYEGIALAGYYTKNLVEGAGGSTIIAALKLKSRLQGKKVALQFSGCNESPHEIHRAYALSSFKYGFAG
ncbi:MAG: threonine ammonia-lyase [Desulforhopalus sp.]